MNILVVDDQPMIRQLLNRRFTKEGFHINTFASAEAAIADYQKCKPDLVITNLMLPGMDGYSLISFIREEINATVPILVISGVQQPEKIMNAFNLGASDFIAKPFQPREVVWRTRRFFA